MKMTARMFLFVSVPAVVAGLASGCGGHLGGGHAAGGNDVTDVTGGGGTLGSGGAPGTRGDPGAGGAAGTGAVHFGEPTCASRVGSGETCTPADQQFCYKPCGPEGVGVKSETCQSSGLYTEMVGCSYDPARDYGCYRIPHAPNTGCTGGQTPQAGKPCGAPTCTPCNSRDGLLGGEFASAAGGVSAGWCVCQPPDAAGARTWSCTNASQWPCPIGKGC
jgi:hypothetical protein